MKYKKSVFRSLALVTQLGLSVIVPIFLCVFAGNYIDSRFGTRVTVFLLILGTLGGARNAYVLARRMIDTEAKEDQKERQRAKEEARRNPNPSAVNPKQPSRVRTKAKQTDIMTDEESADE